MKNRMKLAAGSLVLLASVLSGCGGSSSGGTTTTIKIKMHAGTGTKEQPTWIEQCAKRFEEANQNTSFGSGKKGVSFSFKAEKLNDSYYTTMASDGFNIIIDETRFDAYRYKSNLMDISEVVNLYKDKIDANVLTRCKADQSVEEYYGLPFYEYFPGISYDIDLFEDKNYYIADETVAAGDYYEHTCSLNTDYTIRLANNNSVKKSCGPDGTYGTSDDGLPSSVMEFVTLCDLISEDGNSPIILCGSGTQYSWYLVDGLWASLAGAEAMNTVYCNYKSGGTPLNIVTGFSTTEDLFYQGSGIKKPIVETMLVDDSNGYLAYKMVERYYALALFQLIYQPKSDMTHAAYTWLNTSDGYNAIDAQKFFINGKGSTHYGMLYDASYWYHEDIDDINKWNSSRLDGKKRKVAHMPLPTTFDTPVTEGEGKKNTLMDVGSTFIFVNKNTAQFADKKKAVIEFLKYLYSDDQLNDFTKVTGLTVPKDTGFSTEGLHEFYKQLATFRKESNVISFASTNTRFIKNLSSFNIGYGSNLCSVAGNREGYLTNLINGETGQSIFEKTLLSQESWNNMQK